MNYDRLTLSAAVAVSAALLTTAGCGSVAAPSSYTEYNAKDGSFKCQRPADWETKGGGKGFYKASFKSGPASIEILAKVTGSLLGDIAGGTTSDEDVPEELRAEAQVHQFYLREAEEKFSNYEEKKPEVINTELGEGRRSEFTASGGMGGKIRGFRATVLAHDNCIQVIAQSPEKNWDTLKPAFEKVIDSLGRGTAER
jgi:hypothetical protein